MEHINPFSRSFEVLGQQCGSTLNIINEEAFTNLKGVASTVEVTQLGQQVLLKSPRAGFGKTHLLSRLKSHLREWNFFALSPVGGTDLTALSVTEDIIGSYLSALPVGGGLTNLDLLARQLLAMALDPLVTAGDVPCQDRDSALSALRKRPVETFDFHAEEALTAQWTLDNFQLLGPRLALELANKAGCSHRDASFWVNAFFEYSSASPSDPLRNSDLTIAISKAFQEASETIRMERLAALINMITLLNPSIIVLDETEGLSSNPPSALTLATFFQSLRQACPQLLLILALNSDIWETAFSPRLSGGLKDRLCETIIELKPMTAYEVSTLITKLGGSHADSINADLEDLQGVLYARRIMKEAAKIWQSQELSNPSLKDSIASSVSSAEGSEELTRPQILLTPGQQGGIAPASVVAVEEPVISDASDSDEFVPKFVPPEKDKSETEEAVLKVISTDKEVDESFDPTLAPSDEMKANVSSPQPTVSTKTALKPEADSFNPVN